jgi:hypothetical protein
VPEARSPRAATAAIFRTCFIKCSPELERLCGLHPTEPLG